MNSPFVATAGDDTLLGELEGLVGPSGEAGWTAANEQEFRDIMGEPSGQEVDLPAGPQDYDDYFGKYEGQLSAVEERLKQKAAEEQAYDEALYQSLHEASEQLERGGIPTPAQPDYT